jgi:Protein of unknown function (DUF2690)
MRSSKTWRALVATGAALVATPLIGLAVTTSAQAAGCSGIGCDGQDPTLTGCASSAYTVVSDYIYNSADTVIGRVDLRYSPTCGTNWARTTSYIGAETLDAVVTRDDQGIHYNEYLNNVTNVYTDMIYAPTPACAQGGGIIYVNGTQYQDAGLQAC